MLLCVVLCGFVWSRGRTDERNYTPIALSVNGLAQISVLILVLMDNALRGGAAIDTKAWSMS